MRRRFLAPEVIQSSDMDCGPACLKSLLEAHGTSASYGRLREACQTDVDGTSIDVIEELAKQMGLEAEQMIVPPDYVGAEESDLWPAIAVVRLPNAPTHFVVAYRRFGPWIQVMDPATGRRWIKIDRFLAQLYLHQQKVSLDDWQEWAREGDGLHALELRLERIGARKSIDPLLQEILQNLEWLPLATFDAASSLVLAMVRAKAIEPGAEATEILERCYRRGLADFKTIPDKYWTTGDGGFDDDGNPRVLIRGAIVMRAAGLKAQVAPEDDFSDETQVQVVPPEIVAALAERRESPARDLLKMLLEDGVLTPVLIIGSLLLAAAGVMFEAILFRSFLSIGSRLGSPEQRLGAMLALIVFLASTVALRVPLGSAIARMGRRLELRFRIAFLQKIPRFGDRYFSSRLISDMADRSHQIHWLSGLPLIASQMIEAAAGLLLTTVAIAWLHPTSGVVAAVCMLLVLLLPFVAHSFLAEKELKVRTIAGAVSRYSLDGLLGLVAMRTHGGEPVMKRAHEEMLSHWSRATLSMLRSVVFLTGAQAMIGTFVAVVVVISYVLGNGERGPFLLLVYWSVSLPLYGARLASLLWQFPLYRNVTLRLAEPLGAPEEAVTPAGETTEADEILDRGPGVALRFEAASIVAGGHEILRPIDLRIAAGEHLAIVGKSGAGKSSLAGLLLGWHRPHQGRVYAGDKPLEGDMLLALRRRTAWVDPMVQLWNRTLLENLQYGGEATSSQALGLMIREAELVEVLEDLPSGLATELGEGGGFLSGGQGQRVRIGRSMLRPNVKLVVLDEAFRGLDRSMRTWFVQRARKLWKDATLIFISHDVDLTKGFDRVVVMDQGRIAEVGAPSDLARRPGSLYAELLAAEREVLDLLRSEDRWRRMKLEAGQVREAEARVR